MNIISMFQQSHDDIGEEGTPPPLGEGAWFPRCIKLEAGSRVAYQTAWRHVTSTSRGKPGASGSCVTNNKVYDLKFKRLMSYKLTAS